MARQVALALIAAALLVFAGCGSDSAEDQAESGNAYDRAYIAAMIPHHESAVEMAEIAKSDAQGEFAQDLAADIIASQTAEINQLKSIDVRLADSGVEIGDTGMSEEEMGMDHDASSLQGAKPFDEEFFTMMVPHHEGAVTMSEALLENGSDSELRALAERIITAQNEEIAQMQEQLGVSPGDLDSEGAAEDEHQH
jgi:uncharacterized protein (DUF305 family)